MAVNQSRTIVRLLLIGTLVAAASLLVLLLIHDLSSGNGLRFRTILLAGSIVYLALALLFFNKKHTLISAWLLMSLYIGIAATMLLVWGVNAPVAILAIVFVIFLPGILFGPIAIIWVSVGAAALLFITHLIHQIGIINPRVDEINVSATSWDILAYTVILTIFGLLSWISSRQTQSAFRRTKTAEASLRSQRDLIRTELEEEYARARRERLIEIERLYKFATLGQNAAATLHELSNHLSVLTIDMDDITDNKNSHVIARAKESVHHINDMLRHVRRRLNIAQESNESFQIQEATFTAIHDVRRKFTQRNVQLSTYFSEEIALLTLIGDSLSWSHAITILATNALEACQDLVKPKVHIKVFIEKGDLVVEIFDNGVGVSTEQRKTLFQPVHSTKPNGMGIGLYVTKSIIANQFNGTIRYSAVVDKNKDTSPFESGSKFRISVPIAESRPGVVHE